MSMLIWDNGCDDVDHSVYFIEVDVPFNIKDVVKIANSIDFGFTIAVINSPQDDQTPDQLNWLEGERVLFSEFFSSDLVFLDFNYRNNLKAVDLGSQARIYVVNTLKLTINSLKADMIDPRLSDDSKTFLVERTKHLHKQIEVFEKMG